MSIKKKQNENSEHIKDLKVLEELKEDPEANIQLHSIRPSFKKIPNLKTANHNATYGFWF